MNVDWTAVIGVSVAVMAVAQLATMLGVVLAMRRIQTGVQEIERKVETAVEEFRPQLTHLVDEARAASVTAQHLVTDVRRHLETAEETARSLGDRLRRVVDGVQSVSSTFPIPMKVSGQAAMSVWAGVRLARSVVTHLSERRRARRFISQ